MNAPEQKLPSEEARRRRRQRRNREFKGLKIFPVLLKVGAKKKQFWRVTKPRVGGGRTIKTYSSQKEAETAFDIAYLQAKNYGLGSFALSDVQLIDAREAYQMLAPLGAQHTLVSAVRFLADHVRRIEASVTVSRAIAELLKGQERGWLEQVLPRRYAPTAHAVCACFWRATDCLHQRGGA